MARNFLFGLAALALFASLPQAASAQELRAQLSGTDEDPAASGFARFRNRAGNLNLEVQVQEVFSTDTVWVFVNDDFVAEMALAEGRGRVELETERGNFVPNIQPGDVVAIVDAHDDSRLLLFGQF
jgi:hypothetical protein